MPVVFTPVAVLLVLFLAGNAYGIRSTQGRNYVSAFEPSLPCGTARLAALKVFAKAICVLAAIVAIGVSAWLSISVLGDATFIQVWNVPLSSRQPAIVSAVAALGGHEQLSLVVLLVVGVVLWVAACAVVGALRIRY